MEYRLEYIHNQVTIATSITTGANSPPLIPQVGWEVKIRNRIFRVVSIFMRVGDGIQNLQTVEIYLRE